MISQNWLFPVSMKISYKMKIKRGQLKIISFYPSRGSEQQGIRPALIIQNDVGNNISPNTIVLAVSSKSKNPLLDILINPSKENKLTMDSYIKCDQILTVSKKRLMEDLGKISKDELTMVDKAIKISLDLK